MTNETAATAYILDSFALLAYLEGEAAGELVTAIFRAAAARETHIFLSLLNFGECLCIIERERGMTRAQEMIAIVDQLPIEVVGVDQARVFAAAHIKAHFPLSYADAFAVSLAQEFKATVLTGDPEFQSAETIVSIKWLPQT
ncbi:MAG: type II toxin-antitoxin system VapC family toxin [Caldilineaceae bacterium]